MKHNILIAVLMLCISPVANAENAVQSGFYRDYWAQWDERISNCRGRLRVNDTELSLNENFGRRSEARANGLALIHIDEDLFALRSSELYLEIWGGHPHTADKRFYLNGKQRYDLPEVGTAAGNCTYDYPTIPVEVRHLVRGANALQFACDRGKSFWGHFILDNAALRCYLQPDHADLKAAGLDKFSAAVAVEGDPVAVGDTIRLSLSYPKNLEPHILSVDYFARYFGFDDNGDDRQNDWHGYTQNRLPRNHVGTASVAPYTVSWNAAMIPSQPQPMAVRAVVHLKSGLKYATEPTAGLSFAEGRSRVRMYRCSDMPVPFWSRASRVKKATIELPADMSNISRARLMIKIWDGGEGSVDKPFRINGHAYDITSHKAIHDVVFTVADVDPQHLCSGANTLMLLSDTTHHGIEVLLPGPVLVIRYEGE